jgi:cytochrome c peroxidase
MKNTHIALTVATTFILGASIVYAADDEPISPIKPPANINLGQVDLGKKR